MQVIRARINRKYESIFMGISLILVAGCSTVGSADSDANKSGSHAQATDDTAGQAGVDPGATDTLATDSQDQAGADAVTDAGSVDSGSGDTVATDIGGKPIIDETKGLASPELLVKILGPSGRDWNQSESEKIQLSGVLFGKADTLTWKSSSGKSGKIEVAAYWQSDIVTLKEGDNVLTVTATSGSVVMTDEFHIVYNPFFSFEGAPDVAPGLLFVNEASVLVVRMPVAAAGSGAAGKGPVDPASIKIVEVDEQGKQLKDYGPLVDTGKSSKCDDIQKDSIFSTCINLTPSSAKRMYFRVTAKVTVGKTSYIGKSPITVVDVVTRFKLSECNAIVSLQKKIKTAYVTAIAAGTAEKKAQSDAIAAFKANPTVAEAGPATDGHGVWVAYKTGRIGALNLAPDGVRAGSPGGSPLGTAALTTGSVGTRRALVLAPFAQEFNVEAKKKDPKAAEQDEAARAGADLQKLQCPPFDVDMHTNNSALLQPYREMSNYGVVAISGHGDAYFGGLSDAAKKAMRWEHRGSQEVLWSGEQVVCANLLQGKRLCNKGVGCASNQKCVSTSAKGGVCVDHTQGDIMTGRVVIGAETYGLTPSFIKRHNTTDFPNSIVYLGACRSIWNGSLAVQLYGLGAAAVVGYSGYVTNGFASAVGNTFFKRLIADSGSVGQAVTTSTIDPVYKSYMRMIGDPKANTRDSSLLNPSWDIGKPTGWKKLGDGRVISRLGATVPVGGKFMGIISTGLGFTVQTGSLEQPFCVPKGAQELCFYWKFYSEEFVEFCGSSYKDRFTARLSGAKGQITLTDVSIDPLCPYDCGEKSPCTPGSPACKCGQQWKTLTPADVGFDKNGVYMTPWQKECKDVSAFGGQRVTLKFFCTDVGDSNYDTAVLIDEVTIK